MKRKKIILFLSILLITAGILLTTTNSFKLLKGYFYYKIEKMEADLTDKQENAEEPQVQTQVSKANSKKPAAASDQELYPVRPKIGEEFGVLYIPKLDKSLPIFHGSDENELEKGVGHYANSVLPGEKDNAVLAGHRDTVFRRLGEVGVGDVLTVTTIAGEFTYKVNKVRIVDADDRSVIVPKPSATLTVSTCYPFNFIGDAPQRYILVAHLISN